MPDSVARFTVSIPPELLSTFDEVCAGKGYASRSEAVRDALRDYLVNHDWTMDGEDRVVSTLTLVYDEEVRGLAESFRERQRVSPAEVRSALQVRLDTARCLEVLVLEGSRAQVTQLADSLISLRGVEFGRLLVAQGSGG